MSFPALSADDDLQRRVARFLDQQLPANPGKLQVEAHDGVIVLSGSLDSSREQDVCRNVCTRVAGVLQVIDQTVIRRGLRQAAHSPAAPR